ncbi:MULTISPECIES: hypothetical protein [unclassified Leisingera]|uniref:hypothetical protein n=1 Tax=unclassified Leisingera TaxID=2614906 RepID=UPI00030AB1DF|nr:MULTISPECIES: hypothetical protein [unclassified Leisingera]KIC19382.1 hypothetical protein RA21_02425 [Leisingera sp. ANG-DT]KIC25159.1 hypothetical protein RA23_04570 [Leisingera sp. ANG-S3]KIC27384.1 hypothetical protein RA24_16170 [Leisingera sp. ANG-M6]KIC33770.1 hypothetical protein RA25_07345 [Leisingera sp. ANG-S5]KIC54788.1 hypothetical protein RA22_05480 [Leisingera sp. ANG-S]
MSGTIETLAQKLAVDTLKVQDASGEERFYVEVGQVLGAASQSLEEAFLTEIRVRLAERKARDFLNKKVAELQAQVSAKGEA